MTPDTRAAVEGWFAVAEGRKPVESALFGPFVTLWIAFNALYAGRFPLRPDREAVRSYARLPTTTTNHQRLLDDEAYLNAVNVLAAKGIGGRLRRFTIDNVADCNAVFECVYQVRCNLFHGEKRPESERDQRVVDAARVIVLRHILMEMA
jgi:hypothetical protein